MKRLLLLMAWMTIAVCASSQTITRVVDVKSFNFGCQKLCALINGNDTIYSIKIKQGFGQDDFVIGLGHREDGIRTLQFLVDTKLGKNDIINLENPTGNYVKKGSLGCLVFISQGHQYHVVLNKSYIKKFLASLQTFPMNEDEDADDEEEDDD